jgi:hypothetical protein
MVFDWFNPEDLDKMSAPMRMHVFANFLKTCSKFTPQIHLSFHHVRHLRGRAIRVIPASEDNDFKRNKSKSVNAAAPTHNPISNVNDQTNVHQERPKLKKLLM